MSKQASTYKAGLTTFIVINWKSAEVTAQCIESIKQLKTKHRFEIIIFDNESQNDERASLNKLDVTILRSPSNLGFGGALNQAASQANGEYLAFINNDAVLAPDWLDRAHEAASIASFGAAAGVEYKWDGGKTRQTKELYSIPFVTPKDMLVHQSHDALPTQNAPYVTASNMIISHKAFDAVGGYDADYFTYYEDMDLCAQLINHGYTVQYRADMCVWHRINHSSNRNNSYKYFVIFRNRYRVAAKFYPDSSWRGHILRNAVADAVRSPILSLIALTLGGMKPRFRETSVLHRSRARAAFWALAHFSEYANVRAHYHTEYGHSDTFYKLLVKTAGN